MPQAKRAVLKASFILGGGTEGSNPLPSSSESATKLASCIAAVPRTGELIRVSPLTSAEYRDPLNLDQPALPSWALIRPR